MNGEVDTKIISARILTETTYSIGALTEVKESLNVDKLQRITCSAINYLTMLILALISEISNALGNFLSSHYRTIKLLLKVTSALALISSPILIIHAGSVHLLIGFISAIFSLFFGAALITVFRSLSVMLTAIIFKLKRLQRRTGFGKCLVAYLLIFGIGCFNSQQVVEPTCDRCLKTTLTFENGLLYWQYDGSRYFANTKSFTCGNFTDRGFVNFTNCMAYVDVEGNIWQLKQDDFKDLQRDQNAFESKEVEMLWVTGVYFFKIRIYYQPDLNSHDGSIIEILPTRHDQHYPLKVSEMKIIQKSGLYKFTIDNSIAALSHDTIRKFMNNDNRLRFRENDLDNLLHNASGKFFHYNNSTLNEPSELVKNLLKDRSEKSKQIDGLNDQISRMNKESTNKNTMIITMSTLFAVALIALLIVAIVLCKKTCEKVEISNGQVNAVPIAGNNCHNVFNTAPTAGNNYFNETQTANGPIYLLNAAPIASNIDNGHPESNGQVNADPISGNNCHNEAQTANGPIYLHNAAPIASNIDNGHPESNGHVNADPISGNNCHNETQTANGPIYLLNAASTASNIDNGHPEPNEQVNA